MKKFLSFYTSLALTFAALPGFGQSQSQFRNVEDPNIRRGNPTLSDQADQMAKRYISEPVQGKVEAWTNDKTWGRMAGDFTTGALYAAPVTGVMASGLQAASDVTERNLYLRNGFKGRPLTFTEAYKTIRANQGTLTRLGINIKNFTQDLSLLLKGFNIADAAWAIRGGAVLAVGGAAVVGTVLSGLAISDAICSVGYKKTEETSSRCEKIGQLLGSTLYNITHSDQDFTKPTSVSNAPLQSNSAANSMASKVQTNDERSSLSTGGQAAK